MGSKDSREHTEPIAAGPDPSPVFGKAYQTADGAMVIPVAKMRRRPNDGSLPLIAKPVGVFVVKDGKATWEPAVDATRLAVMGLSIGLVATALAGLAMVRRPPWPDLHGDVSTKR